MGMGIIIFIKVKHKKLVQNLMCLSRRMYFVKSS